MREIFLFTDGLLKESGKLQVKIVLIQITPLVLEGQNSVELLWLVFSIFNSIDTWNAQTSNGGRINKKKQDIYMLKNKLTKKGMG